MGIGSDSGTLEVELLDVHVQDEIQKHWVGVCLLNKCLVHLYNSYIFPKWIFPKCVFPFLDSISRNGLVIFYIVTL